MPIAVESTSAPPPPPLAPSWLATLTQKPLKERIAILTRMGETLTPEQKAWAHFQWRIWARPEQVAPEGDWTYWLILAGRGFGKTRSGAEWVREQVQAGYRRIALVGATAADVRRVMVEGESGLLAICPPWDKPEFEPSNRMVIWSNGAIATLYSAEEPERLRGPQHDAAWSDELAAWAKLQETWDQLQFGLRLGQNPRCVITTTPKPLPLVRQLANDPDCTVTQGSTYDNRANLAPKFIKRIVTRYEGTRLGRQELRAELLEDVQGALWTLDTLIASHVTSHPDLQRIVVAVDPSGSDGADEGDAQGIIVAGLGVDGLGYVLADRTCRMSPAGWGRRTVETFDEFEADKVVAEKNYGGEMVKYTLQMARKDLPIRMVTASRGKVIRAEPIAALYEQGRVKHLVPDVEPGEPQDNPLAELEEELRQTTGAGYVGDGSPNRMDALVWALSELFLIRHTKTPTIAGPEVFAEEAALAPLGRHRNTLSERPAISIAPNPKRVPSTTFSAYDD